MLVRNARSAANMHVLLGALLGAFLGCTPCGHAHAEDALSLSPGYGMRSSQRHALRAARSVAPKPMLLGAHPPCASGCARSGAGI